MRTEMFAAALLMTFGQQTGQPYAGTWTADLAGRNYVRLELKVADSTLSGTLSLADIRLDQQGVVGEITSAPSAPKPIFDVTLRNSTLLFSRKDSNDTDHFEMRITGGGVAELLWVPSEENRQELADNGIAVPKPMPLKRIAP